MREFLRYRDRVMIVSAVLVAAAALLSAQNARFDIAFGVALGGAWSVAKLWLRAGRLVRGAGDKDAGRNVRYALAGSFTLYAITAAVLGAAFAVNGINRWAAVAGLFVTNAVMIVCEALNHAGFPLLGQTHQGER